MGRFHQFVMSINMFYASNMIMIEIVKGLIRMSPLTIQCNATMWVANEY